MSSFGAPSRDPISSADFDPSAGSWFESLVFNNRVVIIVFAVIATLVLAFQAQKLEFNTSFESMIPTEHPFIVNFLAHQNDLRSFGNTLRIVVENKKGNILTADYVKTLKKINDEVFLLPGVDRSYMKSLWTPLTRWAAITAEGLDGGPVMPNNFTGKQADLDQLLANILKSGEIGQLVAPDFKSTIILVPFLSTDFETGKPLDYKALSAKLEAIRNRYQSDSIEIHIVGFAKLIGDLIDGLEEVLTFFAISVVIATIVLFIYTRCTRSTVLVVTCSLIAVVWQLGLLPWLGFRLDPYSILVPFLIFAIGMSHGAQKMNGVIQDIGRGAPKLIAARLTFRRLFIAGLTALVCDAVGFAVLLVIKIEAIHDLAIVASIGVALLIVTNLILLPVLLSFTGVNAKAGERALRSEQLDSDGSKQILWRILDRFTDKRYAAAAIVVALGIAGGGYVVGLDLRTGDLDPGAPELKPSSRYNQDNAYLVSHFPTSSDVLVVMATTPDGRCGEYKVLSTIDQLQGTLRNVSGVESTISMADMAKFTISALNEGSPLWYAVVPNQGILNDVLDRTPRDFVNQACNLAPIFIYLSDHKAETLTRVVNAVQAFAHDHDSPDLKFLLAAGNGGIAAATNLVVKQADSTMLYWVYGSVMLLALVTFRSWRAVLAAVLPLMLTSILAEALMVLLGIGVKVSTLPVVALGVGIGVDYALYILSVTLAQLRDGASLSEAYYRALLFTGKVVMLTGFTLSAAVVTWAFSPIKFQADMGILLAFMFLVNMIGAMVLLPALASFLLKPVRLKQPAPQAANVARV